MNMKGVTKGPERNPSRERMQAELRHLRELVRELEQKRDALEAPASGLGEAWCKVAEYEAEMRKHAEELNVELRARLEEQIAVLERLHELIDEQMKAMPDIDAGIPLKYSDPGVFERFLDDIHEGYEMTASIMNSVEWGDNTDFRTGRVSTRTSEYNGRSQKVLELQNEFRNPTSAIVPGEGDMKSWDHSVQYVRASPMQTDTLMIQESSIGVRYRDMYSEFGGKRCCTRTGW